MDNMNNAGVYVNPGKNEIVQSDNNDKYSCRAVRTKIITRDDSLAEIIAEYAKPHLENGDILFLSEKMVACTQGRAIPVSEIKARFTAGFLSRFVMKSSAGIGLAMPETMQCAIDECGHIKIIVAAAAGMLGKFFKRKGWFYKVAGYRAACIDGPCEYAIPPYNNYVVLAPLEPDYTASRLAEMLDGVTVLIVDINDLGGSVLGSSAKINRERIINLLRQNPLGQSCESTPMGILRKSERGGN